jgi:hypothetical protein
VGETVTVVVVATVLMVSVAALEVPPPGVGFNTVTESIPAVAKSPTGTTAVNCVALTNVVTSDIPFHCTIAPLTKPLPVTVSVKAAPPAVAELGESVVSTGVGFAALIVNVSAFDVCPEGPAFCA